MITIKIKITMLKHRKVSFTTDGCKGKYVTKAIVSFICDVS